MTRATGGQVRALLALRWSMIRSRRLKVGLGFLAALALGVLALAALAAASTPLGLESSRALTANDFLNSARIVDRTGEVGALIPPTMLVFALLCVIAPLAAGGGYELIPESQLVAFPVQVRTTVRLSLLLAPLNVAWYIQVLVLSVATSYAVRGPGGTWPPLLIVLTFIAACTTIGHALGWALVGVRRTRPGRGSSWALLGVAVTVAVWVVATDRADVILDNAPTRVIFAAQQRAAAADASGWVAVEVALLVAALVGYLATVRVADWALRRPGDLGTGGPLARPVQRRDSPVDVYRTLLRMDRASVWRSPPLRRGLMVLAVLPVSAALVASLPWSSIVLLPPLVSSGAAMLFGVNALSLDGSGAVWIATLPHDPALVLRSKAQVVTEVVGAAVVIVLLGAGLRASAPPDMQDLLCAVGASLGCCAVVVATCMRLSVARPHRADLRGPRDTPAPPGTMALYSARLAAVTTTVGLVFSMATFVGNPLIPLAVLAILLAWSVNSWSRTRRLWADPLVRSRVVATVASG